MGRRIIVTVLKFSKNIKKGLSGKQCPQITYQDGILQRVKNKIRVEC
jgi:hypothetical protein